MKIIGLLNGPNLDRLGRREPHLYGSQSLAEIVAALRAEATASGWEVRDVQSNHEGTLIDTLTEWGDSGVGGCIINPGGLTHTSVALRDAIVACGIPTVEVHLSQVFAREPFRHHSYISPVVLGTLTGLGPSGYFAALRFLIERLSGK